MNGRGRISNVMFFSFLQLCRKVRIMSDIINRLACCLPWFYKRAVLSTDTSLQVKRKQTLIMLSVVALGCSIAALGHVHRWSLLLASAISVIIISIITLIALICFKKVPTDHFLELVIANYGLCILPLDISASILIAPRAWPIFIVLVDILLVCEGRVRSTLGIVIFCCIYQLVIAIEESQRFGLLDFDYGDTYTYEKRLLGTCNCDKLPCPYSIASALFNVLCLQYTVFLVDFFCTRGFALSVIEEKNLVIASINTANDIATSLAMFDLVLARSLLDDAMIPNELKIAFEKLISNLESYKPYLPQSCLPFECDSEEVASSRQDDSLSGASDTSYVSDPLKESKATKRIPMTLTKTEVSSLAVNIRNSSTLLEDLQLFEQLVSSLVSTSSEIVLRCRGTTDLFLGDRVYANFGGSRTNCRHIAYCLEAGTELSRSSEKLLLNFQPTAGTLSTNIAMTTGQVACGDLGSKDFLRFSYIGNLSTWLCVVERTGSILGIPLLTDRNLFKHAKHVNECRIVLQHVEYEGDIHCLYEVITRSLDNVEGEWMYQLQQHGAGVWDHFNSVGSIVMGIAMGKKPKIEDIIGDGPFYHKLRTIIKEGPPDPLLFSKR